MHRGGSRRLAGMSDSSLRELIVAVNRLIRSLKLSAEQQKQQSEAITKYAKTQDDTAKREPPVIQSKVYIPPEVIKSYESGQSRQYSLQRYGFWVSLGTLLILGVYTVFTGITVCQIRRQSSALSAQVGIMQKQLEATDRPWISIDAAVSRWTFDSAHGVQVEFIFTPTNVGRSPAQNIWIDSALILATMGDDVSAAQKQRCEARAQGKIPHDLPGYVLFPGRHYDQPIGLQISGADTKSSKYARLTDRGIIPIAVVGCVDYVYGLSHGHHQTGFAFDILMKDGRLIVMSDPLAAQPLILRSRISGSDFIN
jgi:hypothetical protein